ncbi:MAG TPA: amidohydrolase family protein [Nitrososphaerales archaeon]|nr:amidohydrolase family protein [Nitrososphaerales archaeon]
MRLDKAWHGLRMETPWVKKPPSEYIREHVRFTTQPIDEPEKTSDLHSMIRLLGIEMLLSSSDYPHWDNDPPQIIFKNLPEEFKERIAVTNAVEFFGL